MGNVQLGAGEISPSQTIDAAPTAGGAAMEGGGAYNRHAHMQAAAGGIALPFLLEAAGAVDLAGGDEAICIADYGASQGRNSLAPMRAVIAALRARIGGARPITVIHTDLPSNDFSALFQMLDTDPGSYLSADPNVFAAAVGRSFYAAVLPPGHVTLGWSAQAVQWLSRLPAPIPGHFHSLLADEPTRARFAAQSAADWQRFLSLRARELRPSGRLVVLQPALGTSGRQGMERLFQAIDDSLDALCARGVIRAAEQTRMAIADWVRGRDELLAPFAADGRFAHLAVTACEVLEAPDPGWVAYRENHDAHALGERRAAFVRTTFAPSLGAALDPDRGPDGRQAFADALAAEVARRAAADPHEIPQTASVIVLERQAP